MQVEAILDGNVRGVQVDCFGRDYGERGGSQIPVQIDSGGPSVHASAGIHIERSGELKVGVTEIDIAPVDMNRLQSQ